MTSSVPQRLKGVDQVQMSQMIKTPAGCLMSETNDFVSASTTNVVDLVS
ncbi:hypothetical protein J4233_04470 [Candidatus Pacearchaeota archaeon]|nr:hypothetical protein [Candidatus Pacearchaeota archaeon]